MLIRTSLTLSIPPSLRRSEPSRICKFEIFKRFKQLCAKHGHDEVLPQTYNEVKAQIADYSRLKQTFFDYLSTKNYGPWVCKPTEIKEFV